MALTMIGNSKIPTRKILAAAFVAAGMMAHAYIGPQDLRTETVGGLAWSYAIIDGCATVTSWNMQTAIDPQTTGAVVVPDTLGGCPVTAIGSYAFYQMTGITSLTIPEGVESIDFYMCRGCTGLVSVSLPSTLKTMGNGVFTSCESLREGIIPDSVTSMGRDTFWECKSMTRVKFSKNVTVLDVMTCYNCDSLTEVEIPYGVTHVGVSAFLSCDNLRTVSIPDTVTDIGNYAFNQCVSLVALELPEGLTVMNDIIHDCASLGTIAFSANVSTIDPVNFVGCSSLTNIGVAAGNARYKSVDGILYDITGEELVAWPHGRLPVAIPSSIKRIGDSVFSGRRDLTSIDIPEGVVSIGSSAFDMCMNLSTVNFPSTLKTIGERAFFYCSIGGTLSFASGLESIGSKAFMRTRVGALVLPATTTLVDTYAFSECSSLQSLTVLSSACSIKAYAFASCPRLTSIDIAEGASVDSYAYGAPPIIEPDEPEEPDVPSNATVYTNCFMIVGGHIPHLVCTAEGLGGIDFAVDKCLSNDWEVCIHFTEGDEARIVKARPESYLLTDNVFTNKNATITGNAQPFVFVFYNWYKSRSKTWYGYMSIALDENARLVILDSAVCNQQGVLKVPGTQDVPASVTFKTVDCGDWLELDKQCVPEDTQGWIDIPPEIDGKPIRAVRSGAFLNCQGMTKITIPDTIEWIGDGAFTHCTALTEIALPSSVTNVGRRVASYCDSLGVVCIGGGDLSFGDLAFGRTSITRLVIGSGVTRIDNCAFAANPKLASVTIPPSVALIARESFQACGSLKSVSIPWRTIVEDGAFPSGCAITRYGPDMSLSVNIDRDDVDTKSSLMRTLDWHDYESKDGIRFSEGYPPFTDTVEPESAVCACAHLGISPVAKETRRGADVTFYYKMPRVEFLGIDPVNGTITGRVVPAEGTRIVATPLKRAFGFFQIYTDEYTGEWFEGEDWGRRFSYGEEGFTVDFSDYMSSNGVFRLVFPAWVLEAKDPQPSHLFKIRLHDNDRNLW